MIFCFDESSSVYRRNIVMLQKRMLSIHRGWEVQLFTVEFCAHLCTILHKPKVINYPFEIPPDTQNDHLLSKTILFGDNLYRTLSLLSMRLNTHHISLPITIQSQKGLSVGFSSSLVQVSSTRRCC